MESTREENHVQEAVPVTARSVSLPARGALTHKGHYGRVLIVAGCVGYTGAPSLCARAAVRVGAGLVYLGVPRDIYTITAVKNDEAMPFPLEEFSLREKLRSCQVCVVGPGLSRSEQTMERVGLTMEGARGPLVLDADALWAVSRDLGMLDRAVGPVVVTPHEGEFDRLWPDRTGVREDDARNFSMAHGCVTVLKGHRTLCAFPDGELYRIEAGNPGMAKGGSGDVLAGVLGGMLGQFNLKQAVLTGCWLHARAGDLCAERFGEYAMTATDLLGMLSEATMEIHE